MDYSGVCVPICTDCLPGVIGQFAGTSGEPEHQRIVRFLNALQSLLETNRGNTVDDAKSLSSQMCSQLCFDPAHATTCGWAEWDIYGRVTPVPETQRIQLAELLDNAQKDYTRMKARGPPPVIDEATNPPCKCKCESQCYVCQDTKCQYALMSCGCGMKICGPCHIRDMYVRQDDETCGRCCSCKKGTYAPMVATTTAAATAAAATAATATATATTAATATATATAAATAAAGSGGVGDQHVVVYTVESDSDDSQEPKRARRH